MTSHLGQSRLALALLLLAVVAQRSLADDDVYVSKIKPVLKARCFACHGALKQESGLRLDTAALILKGGEGGSVVRSGSPADSELITRISTDDMSLRMPPEGHALTREEIAAITAWIRDGAKAPPQEAPEEDPRDHWAFRIPLRGELPAGSTSPGQNPIDAFINAAQAQHGLKPVGPVAKSLLLRRVYLDLIGLPPTRAQLQAFLKDESPAAWDRVVSDLLDSPHYGERWGRHWMDVWRYTDWFGLGKQLRYSQKHIWHWRDWIVESLNDDKGYDRMITEMLAADELAPTDPDTLRATGFLARNYFLFNRTTWLDNTIEHTSKAFLGLTTNCCKCHDHKYDPLSQVDYYSMRAFFEPHQVRLDSVPGQIDLEMDGLPRVFDAHPETPTYLHIRGNEKEPDKSRVITPAVPALLTFEQLPIKPVTLPAQAHRPALRPFVLNDHLALAQREIETARQKVTGLTKQLAESKGRPAPKESSGAGKLFLGDSFDAEQPIEWESGPGEWKYKSGHLVQTQVGATRRYFRTRDEHPQDFEVVVKFRTTGGDKWKSVGLAFDVAGANEKIVYLSAVNGGSKLQISYKTGAAQQYPDGGKQDRPVLLNEWYVLKLAIRGPLMNVSVDGKHALAFRLPVKRERGRFDLIAFDAAVEFDSIEIRSLPADALLVEAGKPAKSLTPAEIEPQLVAARASLAAAELKPAKLRAAFAADVAKLAMPPADNAGDLVGAAAKAARLHELATAQAAVAQAEVTLLTADEKTKAKASSGLAAAKKNVDAARKKVDAPGEAYTSLRASLKALEGPAESDAARRSPYPNSSTGRRTALARWITDRRNPLTARVAVNHIWMRHFGQPLVDPVTDFGRRTKAPPMQNLLDWLAVELVENGWNMKHLHRLIVTSEAYRLSTSTLQADAATREADPQNQYYWRRRAVRMESQILRDSVLHLAGKLDLKLGGPTIGAGNATANRRSIYFAHSRDDKNSFLSMFDDADIIRCYRRQESIVPQQALTMANSRVALDAARVLSARLSPQAADDDAFIDASFESILARLPNDDEREECHTTLGHLRKALAGRADADSRARSSLIHALFNHNDFAMIR
jgi:mono/diheme cytochrome c family protein